jgi:hypothetical protein
MVVGATLCRDTRALAMRRCTTAYLHRLLVVILVIVIVVIVPIVAVVVVGRVADRRFFVIVVVPGTEPKPVAGESGDGRIAMRQPIHCGGMRSFCPG